MNAVTVVPKGTEEMNVDEVKTEHVVNAIKSDISNKCVDQKRNITSNMLSTVQLLSSQIQIRTMIPTMKIYIYIYAFKVDASTSFKLQLFTISINKNKVNMLTDLGSMLNIIRVLTRNFGKMAFFRHLGKSVRLKAYPHTIKCISQIEANDLKTNKEKCISSVDHITFSGHTLTSHGIAPDQKKIEAFNNIQTPKNTSHNTPQHINYCHQFIANFSTITEPLRRLTKKNQKFIWGK